MPSLLRMPVPRVWGIGLAADNERAMLPGRWRGLNLPGFALMEARYQLASSKLCEHAAPAARAGGHHGQARASRSDTSRLRLTCCSAASRTRRRWTSAGTAPRTCLSRCVPTTVISQVVLSFGIPFALIPLVWLTRQTNVMGALANHPITTLTASGCTLLITAMNVALIVATL